MKLPQIHLRDLFWLMLVAALACAFLTTKRELFQETARHERLQSKWDDHIKYYPREVIGAFEATLRQHKDNPYLSPNERQTRAKGSYALAVRLIRKHPQIFDDETGAGYLSDLNQAFENQVDE